MNFRLTKKQSQSVVDAYRNSQKSRPSQKVVCGFSRRFDASYRDAFEKMQAGHIGRPSVFRSQTCDKLDPSGFFVEYAQFSGGIFVDCSIHDIDLALWFFGEDSVVKSVTAVGITAVSPELRKYNDRDNALGIVEFYDGRIAQLFCSRMMAAGQEDCKSFFFSFFIVVSLGFPRPLVLTEQPPKSLALEANLLSTRSQPRTWSTSMSLAVSDAKSLRTTTDGSARLSSPRPTSSQPAVWTTLRPRCVSKGLWRPFASAAHCRRA